MLDFLLKAHLFKCDECDIRFYPATLHRYAKYRKTVGKYVVEWVDSKFTRILLINDFNVITLIDNLIKADADEKHLSMLVAFS